jgi:molecular chaperone GrpE
MEKHKKNFDRMSTDNIDDENRVDASDFSVEGITNTEEAQGTEEPIIPDEETQKLKAELEEQKDKYVRLFAEFDNFKRRTSKERIELMQTAGKEVIVSMLPVLDDFERAERQLEESKDVSSQDKEGIMLVFNKFKKTLQNQGLQPMESLHTEFDVEKHEAITEIPVDDKKLKGKVVDVVEKGYYLNDKLIRFAKVVVGK